ncbi:MULTISPECIES: hypothetical protein [unclassified Streptomyces]|uniref:hypothetical protein n=1 Tax=unclassified Streptomyces TaxID=2593676 RepID=UPI000DC76573|nr:MULTISPECIES: hypothetical protein [unclassified Streptomyces]AWZ05823.1 hypothetical protein DRB89_15560 [Streptomyces sp. ICC4]AWZ13519.1 hypothetical protein DRB96_15775 [Streptomyces sp. ICC1]
MFTLLGSALAVIGHHLASEEPVSGQRVAVGAAAVFATSWLTARLPRSWWQAVAATGIAQLLLHWALSAQTPVRHGQAEAHAVAPEIGYAAHHSAWVMTAAHCVAASAMALLMYRADQVLSRLPETVGRWAETAVAAAGAAFGVRWRPWARPRAATVHVPLNSLVLAPTVTAMLCHAVVRRGPPAGCAGDVPPIPAGCAPPW